eukprot:scaffold64959_cov41-Phaeocystis_antarctica.AAC.3
MSIRYGVPGGAVKHPAPVVVAPYHAAGKRTAHVPRGKLPCASRRLIRAPATVWRPRASGGLIRAPVTAWRPRGVG